MTNKKNECSWRIEEWSKLEAELPSRTASVCKVASKLVYDRNILTGFTQLTTASRLRGACHVITVPPAQKLLVQSAEVMLPFAWLQYHSTEEGRYRIMIIMFMNFLRFVSFSMNARKLRLPVTLLEIFYLSVVWCVYSSINVCNCTVYIYYNMFRPFLAIVR
jgi:hypothetical protein